MEVLDLAKRFPLNPAHPERNCWGCDRYCPAGSMMCGNGSDRTQHPIETFGPGWEAWGLEFEAAFDKAEAKAAKAADPADAGTPVPEEEALPD
jgi:hypothetical protein